MKCRWQPMGPQVKQPMEVLNGAGRRVAALVYYERLCWHSVTTVTVATGRRHERFRQRASGLVALPHWGGVGLKGRAATLGTFSGAYTGFDTR